MNRSTAFLMSTLALAASMEIASAQTRHPIASNGGSANYAHPFVHKSKLKTLYDQNTNDEQIAVVSQNFESSFDAYDSQGADDFVVPAGFKWTVQEIDVTGVYITGSGPAVSENVFFYKDKRGLPGKLIQEYSGLSGIDSGTGSFVIELPKTGQKLRSGRYWVSVQINMDLSAGGEWGWEKQTSLEGNPAAWQNPGDGFATGCTKWGVENKCVGLGPGGRPVADGSGDKMFALKGKTKGG